jgi:hypothetical protein
MPPKARQNARKLAEQEGRILLAISAIQKHEIRSIYEVGCVYNIPKRTLC